MKFKSKKNDVFCEKIKTSDGKTINKDYVIYDSNQDGYFDSVNIEEHIT